MDLYEVRLPSGRVVRYRLLKPSEADACAEAAGAKLTPASTVFAYETAKRREGVKAFLVSATRGPVAVDDKGDYSQIAESEFVKVDADKFDDEWSALDAGALARVYEATHIVGSGEVGAIMGKVRSLTTA